MWRRWVSLALFTSLVGSVLFNSQAHAQSSSSRSIDLVMIEGFSGPFGNAGEAAYRNILMGVERVNARGGVRLSDGMHELRLIRFDSKGQTQEALGGLQKAIDSGASYVLQGNSSAVASALIEAVDKNNERNPQHRVLFLNYAAVEPSLTNERCSFWHFRFDAHSQMRMNALMQVIQADKSLKKVYLIGQDYSFGQSVLRDAHESLEKTRPDVQIVGDELHPMGRIKDFLPYAVKIKASGAQAVITGNWGNDLTLLIKAARETGFEGKFYTFYGNAMGAPAAIGEAGVGRVVAVADWLPNVPTQEAGAFYREFKKRFPQPSDDYVHMRMQLMIEALTQAMEKAGTVEPTAVAHALEKVQINLFGQRTLMRAQDHQFQQPLVVGVMGRQGEKGVAFDIEGSGYGFRVIKQLTAQQAQQGTSCEMR